MHIPALILALAPVQPLLAWQLSGVITDSAGAPVPFASVYIENTTRGVASNLKGAYYLEVDEGTCTVVFQAVGYHRATRTVTIRGRNERLDITLAEQPVELQAVTVTQDQGDPALDIIRKTIAARKKHLEQYAGYRCETYIKATLEKEFLDRDDSVAPRLKREKLNFIESYGYTCRQEPDKVKEVKTAWRDLAEKSSATVRVQISFEEEGRTGQYAEHNPYLFFTGVSDGDFNFYRNMLYIPKLGEGPFLSPISATAPMYYRYRFVESFHEDGVLVNKVAVVPRNSEGALFSGHLYIVEEEWALKAADLTLEGGSMHFYRNFRLIQNYGSDSAGIRMVTRQEFFYDARDGGQRLIGNTVAVHSNYVINPDFPRNFFDSELRRIEDEAYDRDSAYWTAMRPLTLKPAELEYIRMQDSIIAYERSDSYLHRQDSLYNRLKFWDVTVMGVGYRNRSRGIDLFFYSLLQSVRPFSVGGYHHAAGGYAAKEWTKANALKADYEADYGFVNRNVKGFLRLSYLYKPKKFGRIYVKGGDIYSMVNTFESIMATFSRSNYVHKRYWGFGHEMELFNGFFLDAGAEFAGRRPITDLKLANWSEVLFDTLNKPQEFADYSEVLLDIRLRYSHKQQYYTEPYKKIIVGTKYPELALWYRKGVNGLLESDVDYDFLELNVSDRMKLGMLGELKVNVYAGRFLRSRDIRLTDQKFFRGSDRFFHSNPLKSFQLLGPTLPTKHSYLQAHFIHHFNGMILRKVPLLKKLRLGEVAGAGILLIDDVTGMDGLGFRHGEAYIGIEKPFVLWRQLMKIGVYYAAADSNHSGLDGTLKVGIDFFNSFTNSWSY